jgi:cell division transport system permease protein
MSRTGYFIKEAMANIFGHGFMSLVTTITIIFCLIIMGSSSLLALNIQHIIQSLEDENEMVAFVDESLSEEEARRLQSSIEATANVAEVQFMTRAEAMDAFLEKYDDNSLFRDVDESVFRHRYIISLNDIGAMESTQRAVARIPGIAKINAHLEISRGLVTLRNIVTVVSAALILILFFVSILIMNNTMKIATFNRRTEIAIMKMVGASNSFIRWPFMLEGMLMGLFASLCAFLLLWGGYRLLNDLISGTLSFIRIIPFDDLLLPVLGIFCGVGLIEGVFGSLGAIKSYLRV